MTRRAPAIVTGSVLSVLSVFSVSLLAQCPDGSPPPCAGRARRADATSIAVLSIETLSNDSGDVYLAGGLTDELTTRLGDVRRLRVSGRSAVQGAQRRTTDVAALGRALNVRYLLEGSLRRSGPAVRVSARLLRASDGSRVWGATYDRTLTNILGLQGDIASNVASSITGQLFPEERAALVVRQTASAGAWVHYLRGNFLITRRNADAFRHAAQEYEAALAADPAFAAAHARLAMVRAFQVGYGIDGLDFDSINAQATREADRALRLDSSASDAWLARAMIETWFRRRLPESLPFMERAVALDPRNTEAVHSLGVTFQWLGNDSAAGIWLRRAMELDGGRAVTMLDLALIEVTSRRYGIAEAMLDSAIVLDPAFARPWTDRSVARRMRGNLTGARSDAEMGLRLATPRLRPAAIAGLVAVLAAAGDTADARARLAAMDTMPTPTSYARALLSIGDVSHALQVLERAPPQPTAYADLRIYPEFDGVRGLPVFRLVLDRWRPRPAEP